MTNDPVASAPRLIAVCDAYVLYSITMADLLTSLGEAGLFHPRWTHEIHNEWIRNLIDNRGKSGAVTREKLEARRDAMIDAVLILTINLRDFPDQMLAAWNIIARHPDDFTTELQCA
jgi:hypothetical protein